MPSDTPLHDPDAEPRGDRVAANTAVPAGRSAPAGAAGDQLTQTAWALIVSQSVTVDWFDTATTSTSRRLLVGYTIFRPTFGRSCTMLAPALMTFLPLGHRTEANFSSSDPCSAEGALTST